ncbi:MAG: carboxypeptidase-like regulatory domain-containing protein [Bacteroidales bacterium]|nr:carboxypeptidase-like regulatory domain-containing protein [Bacteroidales bacterium]
MKRNIRATLAALGLIFWVASSAAQAQGVTAVSGTVVDAKSGEPLPFVTVYWVGTQEGVSTDFDGHFELSNTRGFATVAVRFTGYKSQIISLKSGTTQKDVVVKMEGDVYKLDGVTISGKRERYVRKGNPAVELIRHVIAHKGEHRAESEEGYGVDVYEKLTMAIDRVEVDYDKSRLLSKFRFVEKYIDTTQFDGSPLLTISLRETRAKEYYRSPSDSRRRYVTARRMQGLDALLDKEGLATNIDAMFTRVNIFDNSVDLMLNRFVSPLSSSLAVSYYHYYIMDTILVDGDSCIELAFAPVNPESFGFTGYLYIMADSSYALRKFSINTPPTINMNFVRDLSIEQQFRRLENGLWAADEQHIYTRFYLVEGWRELYAHQTTRFGDYDFAATPPDTLFSTLSGTEVVAGDACKHSAAEWMGMRSLPLQGKEAVFDSLLVELRRVPEFNRIIKLAEVLGSGYIATEPDRAKSRLDVGPIYNMVSYNSLEGLRLRVGGMTTTNLRALVDTADASAGAHWFANGYAAYGLRDQRMKYNGTLIYSFVDKQYHPYESLRHALYLSHSYDVEVPGMDYTLLDRDHILMSFSKAGAVSRMQYVRRAKLRYEHEYANRMCFEAWAQYENNEAAADLRYYRYRADGSTLSVRYFNDASLGLQLRYAPGSPLYNNRLGQESPFNLAKDAPVFRLQHVVGLMEGRFWYNRTDISAEKRIWLSVAGHVDAQVKTGVVWNRVPYPKLYSPPATTSLLLTPGTFSLMQPMEFIMDQYISLHATYYMKGLILNRIPSVKRLGLREVLSFSGVYGGLSAKNMPTGQEGMYQLPDGCLPMGSTPYMEASVGIENIFKFIRIDYVRRLSYLDSLAAAQKHGVRFTFRLTL